MIALLGVLAIGTWLGLGWVAVWALFSRRRAEERLFVERNEHAFTQEKLRCAERAAGLKRDADAAPVFRHPEKVRSAEQELADFLNDRAAYWRRGQSTLRLLFLMALSLLAGFVVFDCLGCGGPPLAVISGRCIDARTLESTLSDGTVRQTLCDVAPGCEQPSPGLIPVCHRDGDGDEGWAP